MDASSPQECFPFVVARGRSGTTLLRAMLDSHPDMAVPDESHFVVRALNRRTRYERDGRFDVDRFVAELVDDWAFLRWGLPADRVREELAASPADLPSAIRGVYAAYARYHGKTRYADKTPSYIMSMNALASAFPEARFVHLIRDGRDVALSYLGGNFEIRTLGQAAIYWDRFVRAGRTAGARLGPSRYLEIRYENLVAEPVETLTEVCGFIGLPFDERMLRYHEHADVLVSTLSHKESHQNLHRPPTRGLRDWRRELSPRDTAVFEALAGDLLDELGYERSGLPSGVAVTATALRYRISTQIRRIRWRKVRTLRERISSHRQPLPDVKPVPHP